MQHDFHLACGVTSLLRTDRADRRREHFATLIHQLQARCLQDYFFLICFLSIVLEINQIDHVLPWLRNGPADAELLELAFPHSKTSWFSHFSEVQSVPFLDA